MEPTAKMETEEDDGSEGLCSEHYDGARSKHIALACREYNIMALEATEGGHASVGATNGEDSHGASEEREEPRMVEEGDETPQQALPAQETSGGITEARAPPQTVTCA